MELTIRPMQPGERLYCYNQSSQIMAQTGCIGHLRADMGTDGRHFYSEWEDHMGGLKTDQFKAELDEVINALRFITPGYRELFRVRDGGMIRSRLWDGRHLDEVCRYIDETHLEVGRCLYHICEFAELMERAGITVSPLEEHD